MIYTICIYPNLIIHSEISLLIYKLAEIKKADAQYRNLISNMHLSRSCKMSSMQDGMDIFPSTWYH